MDWYNHLLIHPHSSTVDGWEREGARTGSFHLFKNWFQIPGQNKKLFQELQGVPRNMTVGEKFKMPSSIVC